MVNSAKLIMIDYMCPARPNSLFLDSEMNDFYFFTYPTSPMSQVAFAENYNEIYRVSKNDFGDSKYSRIEFKENKSLIYAFVIASIIALFGAAFAVHLSFMLVKSLQRQYQKFLIG